MTLKLIHRALEMAAYPVSGVGDECPFCGRRAMFDGEPCVVCKCRVLEEQIASMRTTITVANTHEREAAK